MKKLHEFKKEPEVPILDKENRVTICHSGDHEQIYFVPYHRTLLIHIPYAIFKHATYYKESYANDDEPFKEGPNLRRNWSVCMCVSECVRMQMEEALTSIVFEI